MVPRQKDRPEHDLRVGVGSYTRRGSQGHADNHPRGYALPTVALFLVATNVTHPEFPSSGSTQEAHRSQARNPMRFTTSLLESVVGNMLSRKFNSAILGNPGSLNICISPQRCTCQPHHTPLGLDFAEVNR